MNSNELSGFSKDAAYLFILSKIDQYKGEIELFEHKYKKNFQVAEREAHEEKGKEDFALEADLEDWEFALKSLEYWKNQFYQLRNNVEVA